MRTLLSTLVISMACLAISACSDSDSSSGSGGDSDSSGNGGSSSSSSSSGSGSGSANPGQNSQYMGTYRGRLNAVAKTDTLGTIRESYGFTGVVNRNGRLRFRDEDGDIDVVTNVRDNGRFSFSYSADSTVCTGTIAVNGRIVDDTMSGTLSGPARCTIGSTAVSGTITGNFSGTR